MTTKFPTAEILENQENQNLYLVRDSNKVSPEYQHYYYYTTIFGKSPETWAPVRTKYANGQSFKSTTHFWRFRHKLDRSKTMIKDDTDILNDTSRLAARGQHAVKCQRHLRCFSKNQNRQLHTQTVYILNLRLAELKKIPYILESNPHPFYSFRGLKNQMRIRIAVESWI